MARKDWKKLVDTSVALLEKSFKNTANNNDLAFTSPNNACMHLQSTFSNNFSSVGVPEQAVVRCLQFQHFTIVDSQDGSW